MLLRTLGQELRKCAHTCSDLVDFLVVNLALENSQRLLDREHLRLTSDCLVSTRVLNEEFLAATIAYGSRVLHTVFPTFMFPPEPKEISGCLACTATRVSDMISSIPPSPSLPPPAHGPLVFHSAGQYALSQICDSE